MDEVVVVHKTCFFQKRSHFLHGQKPCWSWRRPRPGETFSFFLACNFLKDDGSHRKTDQRRRTAFAWFSSTAFFPNVIFFSVCVLSKLSTTVLIMWRLQISKCSRADKKKGLRTAFSSQSQVQVQQHYLQLASPFSSQPWWHFSQSKVMKCNQSGGPYSFSGLFLLPIKLFELGNQVMQL